MIGKVLADFIPAEDLLPYLEATVAVWNVIGRRDNKFKARIKILVHEFGLENLRDEVETEFALRKPLYAGGQAVALLDEIRGHFAAPDFEIAATDAFDAAHGSDPVSGPGPIRTCPSIAPRAMPSSRFR